jgi:hypothetical protein
MIRALTNSEGFLMSLDDTAFERPRYYDMDGEPYANCEDWAKDFNDITKRRVAQHEVAGYRVSTVLLGLDHNFGSGPPLIFESMIFPPTSCDWDWTDRYATKEQAAEGHEQLVTLLEAITGERREDKPDVVEEKP